MFEKASITFSGVKVASEARVVVVSVPICPGVVVQDNYERLLEAKQKRRVG